MSQVDENDDPTARRLATAPEKAKVEKVVDLVKRYLPQILEAHAKQRHEGKTWPQIGRDLRPDDPIPGDTLSKTVGRLLAKEAGRTPAAPATPSRRQKKAAKPETPAAGQQLDLGTGGSQSPAAPNPFRRAVDPIRDND